ncbi:hypothetical protein NE235_29025 [Actinoallomurus spadix]|uniref:hypothetical protein n=1 Tax=Actinoallomurus spadix TaxID=79912 RepID=UPI002093FD79|nr:hypothetical protein [Actinoallomurus spadix]MCO5990165.1 hypothetical protein [Actinoallomurus spadix]
MTGFVHHLRTQVARFGDDRSYALVDEHQGEVEAYRSTARTPRWPIPAHRPTSPRN